MGRQQKKKDPRKKKKRTESSAQKSTPAREGKNGVAAKALADVSARLKSKQAPSASKTPQKTDNSISGYISQSIQFLREVRIELKKVTWPSRRQTAGSTAVVLVLIILIALFLGVVDFGLSSLVKLVLG